MGRGKGASIGWVTYRLSFSSIRPGFLNTTTQTRNRNQMTHVQFSKQQRPVFQTSLSDPRQANNSSKCYIMLSEWIFVKQGNFVERCNMVRIVLRNRGITDGPYLCRRSGGVELMPAATSVLRRVWLAFACSRPEPAPSWLQLACALRGRVEAWTKGGGCVWEAVFSTMARLLRGADWLLVSYRTRDMAILYWTIPAI